MGTAKRRKTKREIFLAANPICCLCGVAPATTIEHAPARVCFARKIGPEGFEFPACSDCNSLTKATDQIVAFYIHSLTDNLDDFKLAFAGLKNNYPWLLPDIALSPGDKAKFLLQRRVHIPAHLIGAMPIVKIPESVHDHFVLFGDKLTRVLWYRRYGTPMPPQACVAVQWTTHDHPHSADFLEGILKRLPNLIIGNRRNTDLDNQFLLRFACAEDASALALAANFSHKVFFVAVAGAGPLAERVGWFCRDPGWREVSEADREAARRAAGGTAARLLKKGD